MKIYRSLPLLFVFFLLCVNLLAQEEDKNIVIENKDQTFRFLQVRSGDAVEIKEEYTQLYRCNEVRGQVLFSEMYDENEEINDVEIRVDGKKAKEIKPKYDYYSVENIFYSDARVCYFGLPLEKRGSRSEVRLVKTYKDPRYFTSVYFTEGEYVEAKTVRFYIPRWMKADIKEYNFEGNNIRVSKEYDAKNDEDIITYTIRNLPAARTEPDAPGGSYLFPHVLLLCKEASLKQGQVVYFKTLNDQYAWYRHLVNGMETDKEALRSKAQELTAAATNDLEKVNIIFNWVQQNIRYIAFEDGIAGFKPANAGDVLKKKYGDCKGMANLTCEMLKSLGFDARLCWLGTNHIAYDYSTPSMAVDNHMICALIYKGQTYFLDATETNIRLGEYAERIEGRQVLVENGDHYLLQKITTVSPEQNIRIEKCKLHFDGTENLQGEVSMSFKGEARSSLLNKIEALKKDSREKALTNYLSESNLNYDIKDLQTHSDSLLKVNYQFIYKKAASSFGNDIYLEADFRKELADFDIDAKKRRFDLMLPYKFDLLSETVITIPEGYTLSQLPAARTWNHPNINVTISYGRDGNTIVYKKQIRLIDCRLKRSSFEAWNKLIAELKNEYKEQIIFQKQ